MARHRCSMCLLTAVVLVLMSGSNMLYLLGRCAASATVLAVVK